MQERDTARGGYQHRQLFELVQNSADALWTESGAHGGEHTVEAAGGRIEVRLTTEYLYCADDGEPIDEKGVRALMHSRLSPKRGTNQIGTFGLGFKAVLGVSDAPEFFSRSGSFGFDQTRSREQIRKLVPDAKQCPVLRLAEPIDPASCSKRDAVLCDLMAWAVNIVRLPLNHKAWRDLKQQMESFPREFLLFVPHVGSLTLIDDSGAVNRVLMLDPVDDGYRLVEGKEKRQWRLFKGTHPLPDDAHADRRPGDDRDEVPLWWAVPINRLDQPGKFWAFFPTATASLVPGILNAPWKTNEDRQNLLPGPYNDELIAASAGLIAEALPLIPTEEDPARHLDVLPRREESGDSDQAKRLRQRLYTVLDGHPIVPDQTGHLRDVREISYPPEELTPSGTAVMAPFERWAAYPGRPDNWLHHKALTRTRLATIQRLFEARSRPPSWMRRASVAEWLEALVRGAAPDGEVAASMAAVQTGALIPRSRREAADLGTIVLTESGSWLRPDHHVVYLPFDSPIAGGSADPDSTVHSELAADKETLAALKNLGLEPPSPEARFKAIANRVLTSSPPADAALLRQFWTASRAVKPDDARAIIQEHGNWQTTLRVLTLVGTRKRLSEVLMPGDIVPGDRNRDDGVTVDGEFHDPDLLRTLGVADEPYAGYDPTLEPEFVSWEHEQKQEYQDHRFQASQGLPQLGKLHFTRYEMVGPLSVLRDLSEEGAAEYTRALLDIDACYKPWEMRHMTRRDRYDSEKFEPFPIWFLRKHGRVKTRAGIVPLSQALGPQPTSPAALHALLQHPNAAKIKEAFELSDPVPDIFGEGDPILLTDIWPGLREHLPAHRRTARLVPCELIRVAGEKRRCIFHGADVYLAGSVDDDESKALERVVKALSLKLREHQIKAILQRRTPAEIEERRAAIRRYGTDAERLLAAVGKTALRSGLPRSLLDFLEEGPPDLAGTAMAEAAIATYHTAALWQFRSALDHLGPPERWAGLRPAVDFVLSLGFAAEWAGERKRRRPPFVKVEGPWSLPGLHDYQRTVATNVRRMLRSNEAGGVERRGMISLPTGSGKTRVAVQAIVEAIRDDGFRGGVLWVADRDELCEQAVEAWAQVWRSEGVEAGQLRISRLWSGQARPQPTSRHHVVVASIQTLNRRLEDRPAEYAFLKDFRLVVFDEAHRSVAPTYTSVMAEIGLTHHRQDDEPFLIGLTATPYRGHNKDETTRLAGRYGNTRLDSGAFVDDDPQKVIQELQNRGVLAQADHEIIEGDTLRLTDAEWEEIGRFVRDPQGLGHPWDFLPSTAQDRIAQSAQRTRRILDAYKDHIGQDWPTLIFATSVEHAQTLAALLNREGIVARAVSGETRAAIRRRMVEAFRDGEIQALVNYAVFREGFDAPKTRAIIVARPVGSPNLYFQMIGRGLRGPKMTGGTDRCLILNVRDNIEGFGHDLAFSDLDWLWDR